jgi:hypothetical protein
MRYLQITIGFVLALVLTDAVISDRYDGRAIWQEARDQILTLKTDVLRLF